MGRRLSRKAKNNEKACATSAFYKKKFLARLYQEPIYYLAADGGLKFLILSSPNW